MCLEEYLKTSEHNLSFDKNKEKPFGTLEFVLSRVCDGVFNNSKFKPKYTHLVKIEFDEKYKIQFHKFGKNEMLLKRHKSNFGFTITKLGLIEDFKNDI